MRALSRLVLVASCMAGCSSDDDDEVADAVGSSLEQKVLEIGGEDVDVTLGASSARPTRLLVPATAVPRRMPVTVRLSTVTKTGTVAPVTALQIATRNVTFSMVTPARMQQAVPPPPPMKRYVAMTSFGAGDAWVPTSTARRVPTPAAALRASVPRGPLLPAAGLEVWEIDLQGSGLWALALVDDVPVDGGGTDPGQVADGGTRNDAAAAPDAAAGSGDAGATDPGSDGGRRTSLDPAPTFNQPGLYTVPGAPTITPPNSFELDANAQTQHAFSGSVANAVGAGTFYLVKVADVDGGATVGQTEIAGSIPTTSAAYRFTIPLFCGEQLAKFVWSNAAGSSVLVTRVRTEECIEPDVRATISWDDQGRDWELHLVKPGGTINDNATDCTWTSCIGARPDWGVPNDPTDNPSKDVDNTGNYGPENIFLVRPEAGRFTLLVEHWGGGAPSTGQAILNVRGKVTTIDVTAFVSHHVRTLATIDWPSGVVTVINSDFDCSASWSGGCKAALPAVASPVATPLQ